MTKLHARGCSRYTQKQRRHPSTSSTHCTTILRLSFSPLVFFRALLQGVEPAATHSFSHKHADACFGVEESIRDAFTLAGTVISIFSFFFFLQEIPPLHASESSALSVYHFGEWATSSFASCWTKAGMHSLFLILRIRNFRSEAGHLRI